MATGKIVLTSEKGKIETYLDWVGLAVLYAHRLSDLLGVNYVIYP